jgi:hypothetical protein
MLPLRIVESDRDGFDGPIVELWRDDEFIGMVFWDDDVAIVQIYSDDDGDVKDLDARELMRVLDMAERIVSPVADADEFADLRAAFGGTVVADDAARDLSGGWDAEHPATLTLVGEFDTQSVHRTEDGEGFFPRDVADEFIRRCEELDLAVVEMEGFDLEGGGLVPRPNMSVLIRVQGETDWSVFRATANGRALDTLHEWPKRSSLVVAFVVQQPDGETFVA